MFLKNSNSFKNLKTSHKICKKFLIITKIHIILLSEISNASKKFCQKFLKWLVFKFFETVAIFKNNFVNSVYFLKIPLNEFDTLNIFVLNLILKMSCDIYLRIFNKQRNNHGILKKERKIETRSFAKYMDYFGFLPFNN